MKLFFDIDTQVDFLFPAGALYSPGAEHVIEPVSRLNHHAAAHHIPLISTMCAHPENSQEFSVWPPHCVIGTVGQTKPASTLLERRVVIPNAPVEADLSGAQQIILEKDDLDLFSNPNTAAILDRLGCDEFVVYGVFTEYCVRCAITGLLKRGAKVTLVTDAIAAVDQAKGQQTIDGFLKAGGRLGTLAETLKEKL